jgi:peptide/nickel transport system substrate-binding protein
MDASNLQRSVPTAVNRRTFLMGLVAVAASLPLATACAPTPPSPAPTSAPAAATTAPASKPAAGGAAPTAAPAAAGAAPTAAAGGAPTSKPAAASTPAQAAQAQPRSGGILRAATVGEFVNIDGHYYSPKAGLATWIMYDTLTRYDDDLKVQPMLAESWDQSSDARQLTLKLRKGVTFHNGRDFTSDDVLYNFNRVTDLKITAGIITNFIPPETTWEAPDKYTVVVKSKNPWTAVFDFLEVVGILDKETTEGPDNKTKAVGTGPFTFIEWVPGDHLNYGKNKNYWQTGKPYLDGINVAILRDQQSMVAQLEAGALDLAMTPGLPDFVRLRDDPKFQAVLFPNAPNFYMIQANATLKPLDDKRVRQAFAYTLDRQRMRDTVLRGIGDVKALPWAPGSPAYQPEKNTAYSFDLEKAKSLLQQAGVANLELETIFNSGVAEQGAMLQIWQSDLAKIGVTMKLNGMDSPALLPMWHNQTYKGFYIASDAWTNMQPTTFFTSSSVARASGNNGGYKSDAYTQKINALALEPDEAKRKQMLSDLNDFMLDEGIVYPIATNYEKLLASSKVKDIGHRRIPLFKFTETWLDA